MATRVDSMPAGRPAPVGRYPWDEWGDGSVWEVTRGEDFDHTPASFRNTIMVAARRRGCKAITSVRGDVVTFQFIPYGK